MKEVPEEEPYKLTMKSLLKQKATIKQELLVCDQRTQELLVKLQEITEAIKIIKRFKVDGTGKPPKS